jgi:hypothetical protein
MEDRELQKLLYALLYSLRASLLDRQAMLATLRASAKKSKVLEGWEEVYKSLCMNPSAEVSRLVDDQLRPLEEILDQGLDEKGLQELLRNAQKLENFFRSYDR